MLSRGLAAAGLLLVAALAGAAGFAQAQTGAECSANLEQDDAHSGRDAGDTPAQAVTLTGEDTYPAAMSYPDRSPADVEDWYEATWTSDTERRIMVNVSTRAMGMSYLLDGPFKVADQSIDGPDARAPAPQVELEAYAPGDETPTHTSGTSLDGVARLDFETSTPGTWLFHVSMAEADDQVCPSSDTSRSADVQTYNLYWGCRPHCVTVQT